ncbi:hypothetical protein LCGC14_1703160 [marine sediment metagenome]|uniref:Uncharacterized protein n=1 Tax=marine sediment metagenome TaxID=412755 RepID=A0A0F9HH26_9ZZZZ
MGLVFISRDTRFSGVEVRPASNGLVKERGCVQFFSVDVIYMFKNFNKEKCTKKYGSYPRDGTAWLVDTETWEWWRVDHLFDFDEPIWVKDLIL